MECEDYRPILDGEGRNVIKGVVAYEGYTGVRPAPLPLGCAGRSRPCEHEGTLYPLGSRSNPLAKIASSSHVPLREGRVSSKETLLSPTDGRCR